ncbi:MAG: hypothetical protein WD934_06395 [Gemmatimonadales bacterium]
MTIRSLLMGLALTSPLAAQEAWSPLRPLADVMRAMPGVPAWPQVLDGHLTPVGLFWTAGNPAALAGILGTRATLGTGSKWEGGTYRRPLDPTSERVLSTGGWGWRPLGSGAVIGRVEAGQRIARGATFSASEAPYRSDPLVVIDTTAPDMRRVTALLEGGIGWQFGGWEAGVAVGQAFVSSNSTGTGFPRLLRRNVPSASVGVSRRLPVIGGRIALGGRWQGESETILLPGQPRIGEAYILVGNSEPDAIFVAGPSSLLFHRIDRTGLAASVALEGTILGSRWTAWVERSGRRDEHRRQLRDPDPDVWRARGWASGLGAQFALGMHLVATVSTELQTVDGNARLGALPDGDFLRSIERAFRMGIEVLWRPTDSWVGAVRVEATRDRRMVSDFLAGLSTDALSIRTGTAIELGRRLGPWGVAFGVALAGHAATASLPNAARMGPLYQTVMGPEVELAAIQSVPTALRAVLTRRTGRRSMVVLTGSWSRHAASGVQEQLPLVPPGSRTTTALRFGIVLGD